MRAGQDRAIRPVRSNLKKQLFANERQMQFLGDFTNFRPEFIRKVAGNKTGKGQRTTAQAVRCVGIGIGQISIADKASSQRTAHVRQCQAGMAVIAAIDHHIPDCIEGARKKVLAG